MTTAGLMVAPFPEPPGRPLDEPETVRFTEECERAIRPRRLGVKTCDRTFLSFARVYREAGYPVIAIVRVTGAKPMRRAVMATLRPTASFAMVIV